MELSFPTGRTVLADFARLFEQHVSKYVDRAQLSVLRQQVLWTSLWEYIKEHFKI